jgi:uncharacterized protein YdhG (YjbR/CyaY superfamily)
VPQIYIVNMPAKFANPEEYKASLSPEALEKVNQIEDIVESVIPDAERTMSYGVLGYKLNKKTILTYAGFKQHVGIYPSPEIIEKFKDKTQDYEQAKGTIKFPLDTDLPTDLIAEIIQEIEKKSRNNDS